MIHSHTTGQLQVRSFDSNNDNSYVITINEEANAMISCNCPDAIRSGTLCKHMFLVNRMERIGFPEQAQVPQPQPQPLLANAMTR
jgi:hypothetical protein